MISIRGAATVDQDNREQILSTSSSMLSKIIESNCLMIDDIISVIFTCTKDIKSTYPAVAARQMGIVSAGLMCVNEMYVESSLEKCIRVLVLANSKLQQNEVKHIYLGKAKVLRPDLSVE